MSLKRRYAILPDRPGIYVTRARYWRTGQFDPYLLDREGQWWEINMDSGTHEPVEHGEMHDWLPLVRIFRGDNDRG